MPATTPHSAAPAFAARASRLRLLPIACALLALPAGLAFAQAAAPAAPQAAASGAQPPGAGAGGDEGGGLMLPSLPGDEGSPVVIDADRLYGRPDLESVAEGDVVFKRGPLTLKADRVEYRVPTDTVRATGNVEIRRDGNIYRGPEVQLQVQRFEGFFNSPTYFFERTQAGGSAQRFEFLDEHRSVAIGATYTSCLATDDPAWILSTDRVTLDTAADEGQAEGAVLRFYGVPILAAPTLSFPLSDARKSGWLPPHINLDNRSGLELGVPYYWNIAPNRDATFTPTILSRRGAAMHGEFRYLEPDYQGLVQAFALPVDRVANHSRWSLNLDHEARWTGTTIGRLDYGISVQRASDDDYWKDFADRLPSPTPRLLPASAYVTRRFDESPWGQTQAYVATQQWQVLQESDPSGFILPPYEREPQIGVRQLGHAAGFEWSVETEANRFTNDDPSQVTGSRLHALGSIARPWQPLGVPGWTITPRFSINAATYDLKAPEQPGPGSPTNLHGGGRTIPTFSLDSAWVYERDTQAFGRRFTQTLEPRLFYVYTPFRNQAQFPNFDSAPNDFNFTSIYSGNQFSGVDRVSDGNQVTAGVTTRFLDADTGAEALRLGIAQRVQLDTQRVTPDGQPITKRLSDLLLLGATNLVPHWWLDTTVQYDIDTNRAQRSISSVRYSPGPLRTVSATYRYTRDAAEQIELGWQWPLNAAGRAEAAAALARDEQQRQSPTAARRPLPVNNCPGAWYSVGRVNYSQRDGRITDSIIGFEYDAGCWIGRIVAERLSTGRSQATTRLLFQLELVGLSRLGSNPLGVLRENIPGYRLLRDDAEVVAPALTIP